MMHRTELECLTRATNVRGLTDIECRALRLCFRCGSHLPSRRHWWCSDDCVKFWSRNHEWNDARWEALRLSAKLPRPEYENDLIQWARFHGRQYLPLARSALLPRVQARGGSAA
jgi:hypothetical protein